MTAQDILAQLGVEVITYEHGLAYGYFWRNAVSPDWSGPCDTSKEPQRAAIRDLLYFARIGRAYELDGSEVADALLPTSTAIPTYPA